MHASVIQTKIGYLSEPLQQEVLDFIDFLLSKYEQQVEPEPFRFDWEGGLSKLKTQYTAVELQHQAMEWRSCM